MAHKCDGCRYKGEHQEMMFRPMGVCTRELNLLDAIKNYEAEKCPYKKTNYDVVISLPPEKLAERISDWQDWGGGLSPEMWLNWLNQPAEGE